ncbi:MAG TPA: tRNA (adenosine(37)-N6)-threonylcarbamoyltransferase complex dimerization subunit type 1 TsaB, partial [Gammaproteobacteria bacterium]|nr:tRNA (adenosine(37)-N6)-threonylcarbamoyltransferase complex dimerization subunit type 1 TsaB [Gammaproteobacteria bacterium]
ATDACSAALWLDGEVEQDLRLAPRGHAALLLPMVDALLAAAGLSLGRLDALAFGRGPGSFTGLRIAAGMTQGLAFGAGLPVVPVSTLAALAQGTVREQGVERVLAALDARMQEVYWGAYRLHGESVVAAGQETVCPPTEVPSPGAGEWTGAGSGWLAWGEALRAATGVGRVFADQRPQARDIASLAATALAAGGAVAPEQACPVYLRDEVASKPGAGA